MWQCDRRGSCQILTGAKLMTLAEFITYCRLKGLLKLHMEIPQDHDANARHFKVLIDNNRYVAIFIYAVLDSVPDQAVLVRSESSSVSGNKTTYNKQPSVKDIINGIMNDT